jgi:hypothetical protein
MCYLRAEEKFLESRNTLNIAITNPPAFFTYTVRGVGFEPTEPSFVKEASPRKLLFVMVVSPF